jgi:hypothetical protein
MLCSVGRGHRPVAQPLKEASGAPASRPRHRLWGPAASRLEPQPFRRRFSVFRPGRAAFLSEDAYAIRARLKLRASRHDLRTSAMTTPSPAHPS